MWKMGLATSPMTLFLLCALPMGSAMFFGSQPCSRAPGAVQSPCSSPYASYSAPMGFSMQYGQAPPSAYAAPPQYQLPAPIPLPYSSSGYPSDSSGYMQDTGPYVQPQQYSMPPPPPPPAPRAPVYVARPPPVYITPAPVVYVTTPPPPKCWRDQEGFECCSRDLQNLLRDALSSPTYAPRGCNLQKAANDLQTMAQNRFNFSFEAIISPSEMANKSHFKANLICKMRTRDGKVALLYATSEQYSLEQVNYHRLTSAEEEERGWTDEQNEVLSTDDSGIFGIGSPGLLGQGGAGTNFGFPGATGSNPAFRMNHFGF